MRHWFKLIRILSRIHVKFEEIIMNTNITTKIWVMLPESTILIHYADAN